jgi:putative FmdB family regulatory protein
MPTYIYICDACETMMERERAVEERDEPVACPLCDEPARRSPSRPKLLFKGDRAENRPSWHNHDGYSHSHAPRRGRHRTPEEDH